MGARPQGIPTSSTDVKAMAGLVRAMPIDAQQGVQQQRKLLAEMCKLIGNHLCADALGHLNLAPRVRQTLEGLLRGDSEKQIAAALDISPHTVHVYVKQLYKRFGVSSRGELLARFVPGGA